jgi:hypothetical protein
LGELQELNQHLWDNYGDRIGKEDYRKLTGWIRDKERARSEDREDQGGKQGKEQVEKDFFEHNGKKYGKEEAFRLAVEWRAARIKELNEQGAGYTERHGT